MAPTIAGNEKARLYKVPGVKVNPLKGVVGLPVPIVKVKSPVGGLCAGDGWQPLRAQVCALEGSFELPAGGEVILEFTLVTLSVANTATKKTVRSKYFLFIITFELSQRK